MAYQVLSVAEQRQILVQRLIQFEAEHFQHEMNRRIGQALVKRASGKQLAEAKAMVAEADAAQLVLDVAHEAAMAELNGLGASTLPTRSRAAAS